MSHWLNQDRLTEIKLQSYAAALHDQLPRHLAIDGLFDETRLHRVTDILRSSHQWDKQRHTYSNLYVSEETWRATPDDERFVSRDCWQRPSSEANEALDFLIFLRSEFFRDFLSKIFNVRLTDKNVAEPTLNTNYYRLGPDDFVGQHADQSPGREVCMLLYLNPNWLPGQGGELAFINEQTGASIEISPVFNRCVLFDPASPGSEHCSKPWLANDPNEFRYNATSWYWSE